MFKKIKDIINGSSEYINEDSNGGYSKIGREIFGIDSDGNVYGGEVKIRYGRDGFPPHGSETVAVNDVERKMREIEPDLRKWK
ncbi:MAG TPA: hypothetical protein VKA67_06460 [Verrucomicrobiae bacterium]|nr:hypothetical protein [Verrucomicrobiae bacterium]